MDRCSSAGGNSPVDQKASSVDVAVLGRGVEESVEQRIDVLDDLSIEAIPGLLRQCDGVGFWPPALVLGRRSIGSGRRFGYIVGHGETQLRARRNYSTATLDRLPSSLTRRLSSGSSRSRSTDAAPPRFLKGVQCQLCRPCTHLLSVTS